MGLQLVSQAMPMLVPQAVPQVVPHVPQVVPPPALAPSAGPVAMTGRLFLTGVAEDITQDDLKAYFGQFGPLEDVYVQPGGKHIAFVSFPDQFTALAVLQIPDHEVKPGRVVHVEAAY